MTTPEDYWHQALAQELGIIITLADADDKRSFTSDLYDARKLIDNPEVHELMIANPGTKPCEVWIIRKTTDLKGLMP